MKVFMDYLVILNLNFLIAIVDKISILFVDKTEKLIPMFVCYSVTNKQSKVQVLVMI